MTGRQISIWFPEEIERILKARTPKGLSRSLLIARLISRYEEIVTRSTPALSEAEWLVVLSCLFGKDPDPRVIEHEVADGSRRSRLPDEQQQTLVEKLRTLDFAGRLAVLDVVERLGYVASKQRGKKLREWGIVR